MGDEPYYGKLGFKKIPKGQAKLPGPVDPARLLVCELDEGAFEGVSGPIRPDWACVIPPNLPSFTTIYFKYCSRGMFLTRTRPRSSVAAEILPDKVSTVKIFSAIVTAAVLAAATPAQAQKVDLSTITCKQFLEMKQESDQPDPDVDGRLLSPTRMRRRSSTSTR